jgi:hypothetical protein
MLYVFIEIINNISDRYAFKEETEEKPEEDKKND